MQDDRPSTPRETPLVCPVCGAQLGADDRVLFEGNTPLACPACWEQEGYSWRWAEKMNLR